MDGLLALLSNDDTLYITLPNFNQSIAVRSDGRVGSGLASLLSFLERGKPAPYAGLISSCEGRNEL